MDTEGNLLPPHEGTIIVIDAAMTLNKQKDSYQEILRSKIK